VLDPGARSVKGRRWVLRPSDEAAAPVLAQRLGVPEPLARVLLGRGIEMEGAEAYLRPALKQALPDPSCLRDMDAAAERLADAVVAGESVAVFADYDVDGATSAAQVIRYLRQVGAPPRLYIPDRLAEGYGPNAEALEGLAREGVRLVLTVDCGITAYEALEAGARAGLDLIVADHHKAEARLPAALAVVNPNRLDDDSGLGHLAAAGVTFLMLVALNRTLRARGFFRADRPEPDLLALLDLVALGTVCDVVPLTGLNRAFAAQGLKIMGRGANPGLAALGDVAGVRGAPTAYHLGFVLGPRVNAGGRVGRADLGARLLSTEDPAEAREIAEHLDTLNAERRALEQTCLAAALAQGEAALEQDPDAPVIIAAGQGWHPGVIGIVASRLKDAFDRPAFCLALEEDGTAKGSARSISGVDLGAAVLAAREAGLLMAGGGHAMAAGLTIAQDKIREFDAFLAGALEGPVTQARASSALRLDGCLSLAGASRALVDALAAAGPFGAGNPEPVFALMDARVAFAQVVGGEHVRVRLESAEGMGLNAIAFRCRETPLGEALLGAGGGRLHVAGKLRADDYRGKGGVQLQIEDAAVPGAGAREIDLHGDDPFEGLI